MNISIVLSLMILFIVALVLENYSLSVGIAEQVELKRIGRLISLGQ